MFFSTLNCSFRDHLHLTRFILDHNEPLISFCVLCNHLISQKKIFCYTRKFTISDEKRLKYVKYIHCGKSYVDMEWNTVQRLAQEIKKNLRIKKQDL